MKKLVCVVLVSLMASPVWAQEPETPWITVSCPETSKVTEVQASPQQWANLSRDEQTQMCSQGRPVLMKTVKTGAERSPKLITAGAVTGLIGFLMLLPHGDQYTVLGDTYCVGRYSVDYGGCGPGMTVAKIGLLTLGSGILMAYIGSRSKTKKVTVSSK